MDWEPQTSEPARRLRSVTKAVSFVHRMQIWRTTRRVGALDELHESEASEASEASVFCFDNVSP